MRNPFGRVVKRDTTRPSLKERAASLKATAGRVMKGSVAQETAAPEAPSPALVGMVAEWERLLGIEYSGELTDAEMSPICDARYRLHAQICAYPAASIADLAAKLPLFREEIIANEPSDPQRPTMDYQSWCCIVRDLEGAGALPVPALAPASAPVPAGNVDGAGFITYEDAIGRVRRSTVAEWIGGTTARLFSLAREEMARQLGDPGLPAKRRAALTTKLRRDLRLDALEIAAFRPASAFDAAKEVECGTGPLPKVSPMGSVSVELYRAVEAHREARELMLHDPVEDDGRTAAHVDRITALGNVVRATPVRSLADLRHKVIYLWPGSLAGEIADNELANTLDGFRRDVMQMAKSGQGVLTGLDPKAMPMRTLDALCDHARTLTSVCYGLAAQPRSSGSDDSLNEAGAVMLRLAEEVLGQVIDTCEHEARRRVNATGQDRVVRAGMLARPIIEDESPEELKALARDLVVMAEG